MMQKAVMAARAANLEVDEDTAIPTLHWPPDPPTSNTSSNVPSATTAVPPAVVPPTTSDESSPAITSWFISIFI